MDEPGASINIPLGPHLKGYDVPQEVITDILKEGWTDALVWANAFKEEDRQLYFLREGSPYGSGHQRGTKEDQDDISGQASWPLLSSC